MKRLLATITTAAAMTVVLAGPASADGPVSSGATAASRGSWVCVAAQATNGGYCLDDPLPNRLPSPVITIPV